MHIIAFRTPFFGNESTQKRIEATKYVPKMKSYESIKGLFSSQKASNEPNVDGFIVNLELTNLYT